jgi:hypothetical protein
MSETITAIEMAKEGGVDPKAFRAALRDGQPTWHALNSLWTVQKGSPKHEYMREVLSSLLYKRGATLFGAFKDQVAEDSEDTFDPINVLDGRRRIFAAVIRRQGQPAFRSALLKAYDCKCAMTNSSALWVLEAAHITPYRGAETNTLENGLLLRADIHTLFDLGLISVVPDTRRIAVSKTLAESMYTRLDGKKLGEPAAAHARPRPAAFGRGVFRRPTLRGKLDRLLRCATWVQLSCS